MDLEKLKKVIALCRKNGIESIEIEGVKLTLGATPLVKTRKSRAKGNASDELITDEMTLEDKLFWSASGQLGEIKGETS